MYMIATFSSCWIGESLLMTEYWFYVSAKSLSRSGEYPDNMISGKQP